MGSIVILENSECECEAYEDSLSGQVYHSEQSN